VTSPPKLLGKYATPRFTYGDVVRGGFGNIHSQALLA
jgi:hypothetical protein